MNWFRRDNDTHRREFAGPLRRRILADAILCALMGWDGLPITAGGMFDQ